MPHSDNQSDSSTLTEENICPICCHEYPRKELTRHHIVPKSRKGKETVLLCRNCHRQIHALFTEKELERHYGTIEKLLAAERLAPWVKWSRKRRPNGRLRVRTSRSKRRLRR